MGIRNIPEQYEIKDLLDKRIIKEAITIMKTHPRYSKAEIAVNLVFKAYPENVDFPAVLAKVCILNDLYGTNIYNTFKMAEHICNIKKLDAMIQARKLEAVDFIRHDHGIKTKSEKDRDFYSFATKYCSFHNPAHFPIWDNLVSDLIYQWNKYYEWDKSLTHAKLHEYPVFTTIIKSILKYLSDRNLTVKTLDMGLWIIGKYVFRYRKNVGNDYVTGEFEKRIEKIEGDQTFA